MGPALKPEEAGEAKVAKASDLATKPQEPAPPAVAARPDRPGWRPRRMASCCATIPSSASGIASRGRRRLPSPTGFSACLRFGQRSRWGRCRSRC